MLKHRNYTFAIRSPDSLSRVSISQFFDNKIEPDSESLATE